LGRWTRTKKLWARELGTQSLSQRPAGEARGYMSVRARWRAWLINIEKTPLAESINCEPRQSLHELTLTSLFECAEYVVESLNPRVSIIKSLCAVVYTANTTKTDRLIKSLRRRGWDQLESLVETIKSVDEDHAGQQVHVDFDLTLNKTLLPTALAGAIGSARSQGPRAARLTATQDQIEALDDVILADRAGNRQTIDI
jgi:hypothetical protein